MTYSSASSITEYDIDDNNSGIHNVDVYAKENAIGNNDIDDGNTTREFISSRPRRDYLGPQKEDEDQSHEPLAGISEIDVIST